MAQQAEWNPAESPDDFQAEGGLNIFRVLLAHKFVVICMVAIALGLGYLYHSRATRIYQSSVSVLLIKKKTADLPVSTAKQETSYEDQLSTHMLLIQSPMIVEKAVQEHSLASLSSLKGSANPVAAIIGGLSVTRGGGRGTPDPNIMVLNYAGTNPAECATILEAIVITYQDDLGETYQGLSEEFTEKVSLAHDNLHKTLTETKAAHTKFQQESPLLWKGENGANMHQMRMAQIEAARSEVLVTKTRTEGMRDAVETAMAQGGSREALALFIGTADPNQENPVDLQITPRNDFEKMVFTALLEEQMLLEDYGPDHPKVKAAQKKMQMIREHLGNMPLPEEPEEEEAPVDFVALYLESLRHQLTESEKQLQRLDTLFEQEREAAKALADIEADDEKYRNDIAVTKQVLDPIVDRLNAINLIQDDSGVTAKVISSPEIGALVKPKLLNIMAISGVLGCLVGFGLAYLIELADKRFDSPEDVHRQLALPIVGHIPVIARGKGQRKATGAAKLDATLCTCHRPQSRQAEAYRAVRTALFAGAGGENHKVIQVTSPVPGDGKTTLAANLAVSIANSGKSVLLIDGDSRRPRVHKLFSLRAKLGLGAVLEDKVEVVEAIQNTPINNLHVLPCGHRPKNPGDQLTSARLAQLFEVVREKYDFVVVDTPPLLAVTDPAVIAKYTDGVLLVIRLTKHSRATAVRASEMLHSIDAPIVGVVVNGLTEGQGRYGSGYRYGGYRYGGYRYGNGSRYGGYQYGYSYGYDSGNGSSAYYTDDHADESDEQEKPTRING